MDVPHDPDLPIVVCERCFTAARTYQARMPLGWRLPRRWCATDRTRQDRIRHRLPDNVIGVGLCLGCRDDVAQQENWVAVTVAFALLWWPAGPAFQGLQDATWDAAAVLKLLALLAGGVGYAVVLILLTTAIVLSVVRPVLDAWRGVAAGDRLYRHMRDHGTWDWPACAHRKLEWDIAAQEARRTGRVGD